MGLSRLDNFLKSTSGRILYVDPTSLDSTDSIENSGNSLTRPFKTIQRALIESARFSYQRGLNNDRFNKTTIVLYPGDHLVDNRPGYIATGTGTYAARSGATGLTDIAQWDLDTVFDLTNPDNTLYKLNSIYGGVIVPRGTSIVGMDLRKTRIRPTYVPNPVNDNIERSAILRVTGGCYFWQFTILDADPNGICYEDYTTNVFVPNYSHHKLSGFEYADGVNSININDDFLTYSDSTRTDLDNYYDKVAAVYGASSGREIQPDYGTGVVDIQPVIDEYRIVGSTGASVGITSIRSGDGVTSTNIITVDLLNTIEGLSVDSPIQIQGVGAPGYDGQYVIASVPSSTQITYQIKNPPLNPLPGITGSTLSLSVDTVTSASPYIFNISLRSVYGMCGLLADGDKATGFKSMVVAQYTGIGLQKDENAFVKYDLSSGSYKDSTALTNLHTDSSSRFKPEYENFHIKATNDAFLQLVSVFAIGYAQHFVTENGGDIALNNSNSNFGAKSLVSTGFKRTAFPQDDYGYITHIIPPREIETTDASVEFLSLDVGLTTSVSAGAGTTSKLYLYNETNQSTPPSVIVNGYHIGAKQNETLNVQVYQNGITTAYSSNVVMPYGPYNATESSSQKTFTVNRSAVGINSISSVDYTVTLTQPHSFIVGESIRVIADNGHLPDGLQPNQLYYVITKESVVGLGTDQIRIAKTTSDAINGNAIQINEKGGVLSIVSRVSDKVAGDIGHPVQYDNSNWYINVSTSNNGIYDAINSLGTGTLGSATNRTYVTRKADNRSLIDTMYRVRYVLPKDAPITARPPVDGFILQESNNILGAGTAEISQLYNNSGSLSNSTVLRNPKFIAGISWSSNVATVVTEVRHNLEVGDQVEVVNVNPTGYNGTYTVTSTPTAKQFTYALSSNPGTFGNNTSVRDSNLPYFRRKRYSKTYQVYRTQEIQPYVANVQDGVYYLTLINHSNSPTVTPFRAQSFAQPVEDLYPQTNTDNPKSDPDAATSFAVPDIVGKVVVNDLQNSVTKETLQSFVGFGITNIQSSSGTAHTIYTTVDHQFSGITSVSIVSGGLNYGSGTAADFYNARLTGSATGSNATAKVTIDGSGVITAVKIIDGGSAYIAGDVLTVVGIATTTGFVAGTVSVQSVSNNIGDTIKVSGVSSAINSGYNTLYQITGAPTSNRINVVSTESISGYSTTGIGSIATANAEYLPTGKVVGISSFVYSPTTGIATVGFTTSHGFRVDNKVRIVGANQSAFNGDFIVKNLTGLTSFTINVGVSATTSTSATGTLSAYRPALTSYGGDLVQSSENVSGRLNYEYAGITTTLGTTYLITASDSTTNLNIPNAVSLGFNFGDYLQIDNEIFRIKAPVTSDSVPALRAIFGSPRQTHVTGSVITRIAVRPVELRRNSIIRASGHTFEYLGFGPGNYSTSLPQKQNRVLSSTEKFLAQATKTDGGIVVYTGMDSEGSFYAGNKKINSATGKEETFDTPIPTTTGEKSSDSLVNITETQKLFVTSSIKVDGGVDKNSVSEFDGPVIFNNKVTTNSDVEANSIMLQGDQKVSRKYSVSATEPTYAGNPGDVVYNATPTTGDYIGWVYTSNNQWEKFGRISPPTYDYAVGVSDQGNYIGIASLINFATNGIALNSEYDSITGITTLTFTGTGPQVTKIGVSTSTSNTFSGVGTQINFVGTNIGVSAKTDNVSGITTVNFVGIASTDIYSGLKFIKTDGQTIGGVPNILRVDGTDSALKSQDVYNALGYIPAQSSTVSNYPTGNSIVLDDISSQFNGTTTDFTMKYIGTAYIPFGSVANLIVSIGGVIQKPGLDYIIVGSGTTNTSTLRFTTAPISGLSCFIVSLGGQGILLQDPAWDAKGDLIVGTSDNNAARLPVGSNGQVLTVDSTVPQGISWKTPSSSPSISSTSDYSILDAKGDLIVGVSDNNAARLPVGLNGTILTANSSASQGVSWANSINISGSIGVGGTITINGGSGGTALKINSGGDLVLSNSGNTGTASLYCDTNNELKTSNNVYILGALNVGGDITAFYTSDQRLKNNITPIPNALDKVVSISGNTFDWNEESGKEGTEVGVIAQEILEVLPEAVTTRDNGYLAVKYDQLIPLLIEAIKELRQEVKELKEGK